MSDTKRLALAVVLGGALGAVGMWRAVSGTVNTWSIPAGKASLVRVQGPAVLEELPGGVLRLRSAWPLEVSDATAPVGSG